MLFYTFRGRCKSMGNSIHNSALGSYGAFFSARVFLSSCATASPTSLVEALPPISLVRMPASIVRRTASSTAFASKGRHNEYCRSMAMERIAATGLTRPLPEISGAEPGCLLAANAAYIACCLLHTVYRLINAIDQSLAVRNTAQTRTR